MKRLLLHFAIFLALAGAGALVFVVSGLYDISATDQHLRVTYRAITVAMERSVQRRAKRIEVPLLDDPAQLARGFAIYREHCVACHGAPGVAPAPFSLALRPLAVPLVRTGRDMEPAQVYWIVKHGIKMTGMPAWEYRMSEDDLWATVAFVKRLPYLSPADYGALQAPPLPAYEPPIAGPPNLARGKRALEQYACVSCHEIPRLVGPEARVGPTLHGMGSRLMIAGVLPNSPGNMARFLREPQRVKPGGAMPDLGVNQRDARDMAAFLATLK